MNPTVDFRRIRATVTAYVVLLTLLSLVGIPLLTYPPGRDQGAFACVARSILQGGMPYRDAWDIRPPGIFFAYAAALGGLKDCWIAIPVAHLMVQLAAAGLVMAAGRRLFGAQAGFLAGLLYGVLAMAGQGYTSVAQPESVMALFLAASACLIPLEPRAPAARFALCGIAVGVAAVFGLSALLMLPVYWAFFWRRKPGVAGQAALLIASLAPVLATAAYFWGRGALSDLVQAQFLIATPHDALSRAPIEPGGVPGSFLTLAAGSLAEFVRNHVALVLSCLFLLAAIPAPREDEKTTRSHELLVLNAAAAMLAAFILQGTFLRHEILTVLPFAAIAAGAWYARLRRWLPPTRRSWGIVTAVALVGLAFNADVRSYGERYRPSLGRFPGSIDEATYVGRYFTPEPGYRYLEARALAGKLAHMCGPTRSFFIWGGEPEIYFMARTLPPTRFIFNAPLTTPGSPPEWRSELLTDLTRARPAAILVIRPEADMKQAVPDLAAWIDSAYEIAVEGETFFIYTPRGQDGQSPQPTPAEWRP